jgi:hypothetical protein
MLRVVDIWESDLNRLSNNSEGSPICAYTSAQNFYPPCVFCGDTCSGWRVELADDLGKRDLDWACRECATLLAQQ